MQETWVRSLGWGDPLEEGMAPPSSVLAWRTPWMEEPGRLQSMGSQSVRQDWATQPSPAQLSVTQDALSWPVGVPAASLQEHWSLCSLLVRNASSPEEPGASAQLLSACPDPFCLKLRWRLVRKLKEEAGILCLTCYFGNFRWKRMSLLFAFAKILCLCLLHGFLKIIVIDWILSGVMWPGFFPFS